mmetsp:Transcript_18987/g.18311  ORF Transcript_18987/g.18311 Transcript_18987/m.18311 type:complete len:162 (+) Transcript_18987:484-969(+)
MMDCYKTNCIGTLLTLQTFTPHLEKGALKLCVFLSSRLGSITTAQNGSYYTHSYTAYRASKAAMNMLAMTYAGDSIVKQASIRTLCLHPGWVQTDMGGGQASQTIPDSCTGILNMIGRASVVQSELMNPEENQEKSTEIFETELRNHGCVFSTYLGELIPW